MVHPERSSHTFLDFNQQEWNTLPGIIVPQQVYQAPTAFEPLRNIRFYVNGRPGVLLSQALAQDLRGLADAVSTPSLTEGGMRIALRILVRLSSYFSVPHCSCAISGLGMMHGVTTSTFLTIPLKQGHTRLQSWLTQ